MCRFCRDFLQSPFRFRCFRYLLACHPVCRFPAHAQEPVWSRFLPRFQFAEFQMPGQTVNSRHRSHHSPGKLDRTTSVRDNRVSTYPIAVCSWQGARPLAVSIMEGSISKAYTTFVVFFFAMGIVKVEIHNHNQLSNERSLNVHAIYFHCHSPGCSVHHYWANSLPSV